MHSFYSHSEIKSVTNYNDHAANKLKTMSDGS